MSADEKLIEKLAAALWNRIPYDHNAGCPTCPTFADALAALRGALKETGLAVAEPEWIAKEGE